MKTLFTWVISWLGIVVEIVHDISKETNLIYTQSSFSLDAENLNDSAFEKKFFLSQFRYILEYIQGEHCFDNETLPE